MATQTLPRPFNLYAGRFRPLPAVMGQCHYLNAPTLASGPPSTLPAHLSFAVYLPDPLGLSTSAPVCGSPVVRQRRRNISPVTIVSRSRPTAALITGHRAASPIIIGKRI